MPQYLSTDPNAGKPMDDGYVSTDPNAGQARQGESLRGLSATESFFGPHRPIGEGDAPEGALDRLNAMLRGPAQPSSLGDVAGLLIPQAAPHFRVPLVNMLRETLQGAKQSPNWRSVPGDVIERLYHWATTPDDAIRAERYAMAPRLAGKAPSLNEALVDAVGSARKAEPTAVSLPGGGAVHPKRPYADYNRPAPPPSGPRLGAYSSDATASAPRSAAASGAPPAVAPPSPARPAPPPAVGMRLTPEESQALQELVGQGYAEADVLQAIQAQRPAAPPAAARATAGRPSVASKPSLSAAEAKEYQRLLGRGLAPEKALDLIEQQRAFQTTKQLPTSEQTRRSVADRNATGRWD
jgi:hypothetical protein